MLELLLWLMLFGAIFFAWRVRVATQEMNAAGELVKQALASKFIVMTVEETNEGVFAYRFKSGDFLAHGSTFEVMKENFKSRFPEKTGLIISKDGQDFKEV
jgi:hypothetical protein